MIFLVVYKILIVVLSLIDLNLNVIIQKILKITVELAILMALVILKNWIFFCNKLYNFKHLEYDFKYVKFDIFSVLYVQKICSGELLLRSLRKWRKFFRNTGMWYMYIGRLLII